MVGKERESALNRSGPKAEYMAREGIRKYGGYGTAGKQYTVCVPTRTKCKWRPQFNYVSEAEEKHDAPAIGEGMSAGKTTGCMYSRKYTTSRPTCSATVYDYVNSEDRAITTASSSSYALKTSCYPEQPYGGEHYLDATARW